MYALRPEFGPTLPELLSGRSKAWRYALIGGYVLILVVVLYLLLLRGDPSSTHVVKHGDVTFNLTYDSALKEKPPVGNERLRLEGTRGREVVVEPLLLPAYEGQADGFLPAYAERLVPEMKKQFDGFAIRRDGRASVNRIPGYEIVFFSTHATAHTAPTRATDGGSCCSIPMALRRATVSTSCCWRTAARSSRTLTLSAPPVRSRLCCAFGFGN